MGPIGVQEMIFIFILALLLFGPKKLPELARMLGKGLSEFRRAKSELQSTFNTHLQELEREARMEEAKKTSTPRATPVNYASSSNPYTYAADEFGQTSSGYDYSSSGSAYPAEPAVESHSTEPVHTPEPREEHSGTIQPVAGSVARSNGVHPVAHVSVSSESKDDHTA